MQNKATTGTMACHVVAMPYPGRSHINAVMNLCKQLSSRVKYDILITFVVTEEWFGLIGSDPKPDNIRFATIPNVVPSEHVRAEDLSGFFEAVSAKLEAPFEELLDGLHGPPVKAIIADSIMAWPIHVGNKRNIPVASFWPLSASMFSVFYHFDLLKQNGHYPIQTPDTERDDTIVDYIPGISTTRLADISDRLFHSNNEKMRELITEAVSKVTKVQYLLSTSVYELESQVFDVLVPKFSFPIYPIGPISINNQFQLENPSNDNTNNIRSETVPEYIQWLDSQPKVSVLYISFGSFLSVSDTQLDEIVAGIGTSGVRHMWVARENVTKIKDGCGDVGFVVPWCEQLRVLCHPSIGGFWTHCGWNSTLEAIYAGVPMLTFPITADQHSNSKQIVEEWKIGCKVNDKKKIVCAGSEEISLVRRDEISELAKEFMDPESNDTKLMRNRVKELQKSCQLANSKGGSSHKNLDAFIENISPSNSET
ncbi:UDP-glycosyltransferase 87A1-like isoform X2 [Humulus lupulus]|uniref:UDP-glycosyltransferase 87A1-like isoform X2 n=1 Tax=Humulus lupulus TaxID=3486 RepID=UPI002B405669|nr:UDP-glycosyltransferase 87A1-like isoform X2 [Humulus lupulus]